MLFSAGGDLRDLHSFPTRRSSDLVWLKDWDSILARLGSEMGGAGRAEGFSMNGMQVVVAGGCDFYSGSATSSPSFSFSVTHLRVAGEGDLLEEPAVSYEV